MKATLIDLFTSKKFLAALSAVAIYLAGRFGFALDPAALDRIFAALLVYVGAQGVADVGKGAAQVRAAEMATFGAGMPAGLETGAALRVAPPVAALLLAVLAITGATLPACGAGQVAADTGQRVVDCAKLDAGQVAAVAAELARGVATYVIADTPIDWDAIEAQAEAAGLAIGGCALGPLVAAPRSSSSAAPARAAAPPPPSNDAARAWAAFARLKARAGVGTYQTGAGPL